MISKENGAHATFPACKPSEMRRLTSGQLYLYEQDISKNLNSKRFESCRTWLRFFEVTDLFFQFLRHFSLFPRLAQSVWMGWWQFPTLALHRLNTYELRNPHLSMCVPPHVQCACVSKYLAPACAMKSAVHWHR